MNLLLGEVQANPIIGLHHGKEWDRNFLFAEQVTFIEHEVGSAVGGEIDDETTNATDVTILRVHRLASPKLQLAGKLTTWEDHSRIAGGARPDSHFKCAHIPFEYRKRRHLARPKRPRTSGTREGPTLVREGEVFEL